MAAAQARAVAFLEAQKKSNKPELKEEWQIIETLYEKKLWNEMTTKLLELVKSPHMQQEKLLLEMYEYFIESIEIRLNPFGLVTIMEVITSNITKKTVAMKLLQNIEDKIKNCDEAFNYCKVLEGAIYLKHLNNFPATKQIIEDLKEAMEFEGNVTDVHGKYFMLAAEYYRLVGDFNGYYRSGMLFLACALDKYPQKYWPDMAFTLSIAALLGDNVFNVGQLLLNPIMESLIGTQNEWMVDMIKAFHDGNVDRFLSLKPKWSQITDLRKNESKLRDKIPLLALMELTFKRSGENRRISFEDIAKATKVPLENVELLVLKAFALDLVRGEIDQVAGLVHMTWVRPRVLDRNQISDMARTIDNWSSSVTNVINVVHRDADEIVVTENY